MDEDAVLSIVKAGLGISTAVRDTYLKAIVQGVITELTCEKGLVLDGTNPYHLMFVVDYATWRYQSRDKDSGMPRHLQYRLHNLFIHVGAAKLNVDSIETMVVLPITPEVNTVYILSDGSKQMYIDDAWKTVSLVNGTWVVVTL